MEKKKRILQIFLVFLLFIVTVSLVAISALLVKKYLDENVCDHEYTAWVQEEMATCTTYGREKRICTKCNESEINVIPRLEHLYRDVLQFDVEVCAYCNTSEGSTGLAIEGSSVVGIGICEDTSLVIPKIINGVEITSIADKAFQACSQIVKLEANYPISIGDFAFSNCSNLTNVITNTIHVGVGAFNGCKSLKKVNHLNSVQYLGDFSYANCPNLELIEIDSGRDYICFAGCSVSKNWFLGSDKLNVLAKSNYGYIFSPSDNVCINIYPERDNDGKIIGHYGEVVGCFSSLRGDATVRAYYLGYKITKIQNNSFKGNLTIKNLVIENGITAIDSNAFYGCLNLEKIVLPDTLTFVGASVFSGCPKLKYNITEDSCYLGSAKNPYYFYVAPIDYNIKEYECIRVHNRTKLVASTAFMNAKVSKVVLPSSVIYVGIAAFKNTSQLSELYVGNPQCVFNRSFEGGGTSLTNLYYAGTEAQFNTAFEKSGYTVISNLDISFEYEYSYNN